MFHVNNCKNILQLLGKMQEIFIVDALIMIFSPVGLAFERLTLWISISLIFTGVSLLVGAMRFNNYVIKYDDKIKNYYLNIVIVFMYNIR